jgi:hypothetical protein
VLAEGLALDVPRTCAALSERGNIFLHALYYSARGPRSVQEKVQSKQYLASEEEKSLVTFLVLRSDLGQLSHTVNVCAALYSLKGNEILVCYTKIEIMYGKTRTCLSLTSCACMRMTKASRGTHSWSYTAEDSEA